VHLRPFGCLTELGAKQAELVQKFMPRSRIGSFRDEGTRSTPLDPKLRFWCISYYLGHLGPLSCLTELGAKRAELVQKFVPRSRVRIFRNEHARSTPLDPKLTFWSFRTTWVHLGPFGCLTELGAKRAELVQKFVPQSRIGIFRDEGT
jgi:hypothetical protein